ncbi:MAG: alpha/beta fold hydrolase [Acidimicrobiia bacterium]|nr:alpha/beta fold hydrolase [Acidimicrobiia bacterium]
MPERRPEPLIIESAHGPVSAAITGPHDSDFPALLLAHGAGAGMAHPWMVSLQDRLATAGARVMTFNYAYTEAGRRSPDRLEKLLDVHEAAADVISGRAGIPVLAGKSMGGRVASHLVSQGRAEAAGLAYLGYPLVAMGKTEPRSTDHLDVITAPQLFVTGDRDRMGPIDLISDVADRLPAGEVVAVPDGDHSFVPRKSSGLTLDDSFDLVVREVIQWLRDLT